MADTTARPTDTARKMQDTAARSSQAAIDSTTRTARDTISQTEQMAQQTTEKASEVAHAMAESVAETADAATEMSSKVADQGRQAMMLGMRTAAGVGGRIADINFGRGHHLLSSSVQAMDVYRDAAERSAERLQALFNSYVSLSRGMQQMQHAWLEMVEHAVGNGSHKPQDLLRCTNLVEVAEVQRDLYLGAVHHAFDASSRLLEMAGRTAQDAVRPLQSHRN